MIDDKKIQETIFLNEDFYKDNAEAFSRTRQTPWRGWRQLLTIITDNIYAHELTVVDLGCGNGRFYKYLKQNTNKPITYTGYDTNDYLLVEALLKYEDTNCLKKDIINEIATIEDNFNLVVAFGITHHIPGYDFRKKWFENLGKLVAPAGILAFTNWQLNTDERISKAEKATNLEENDYYYGWGDENSQRYVHIYSDEEMHEINEILEKQGLNLLESYENDGKSGNLNKYFIYRRD